MWKKWNTSISMHIVISETLYKYNSSIGYYNYIYYATTSEDGNYILLKKRQ